MGKRRCGGWKAERGEGEGDRGEGRRRFLGKETPEICETRRVRIERGAYPRVGGSIDLFAQTPDSWARSTSRARPLRSPPPPLGARIHPSPPKVLHWLRL